MTNQKDKIIFFDFDGVFINTFDVCFSINQEVNENLSQDEYKSFFHGNIFDATRQNNIPRKNHPNFSQRYIEKTHLLEISKEMKSIIEELTKKYTLTIISSTETEAIKKHLQRANISNSFSHVLGADIHKSKVYKIQYILDKYKTSPTQSIFITDTLGDIKEASKCDVKSVAVLWGWHDFDTLKTGSPEYILKNPTELIPSIEDFFKRV